MLKVKFVNNIAQDSLDIYILQDEPKAYLYHDEDHVLLTIIKPGETIKPFISLSGSLQIDFLNSMAKALDEYGIKTDKDAKILGLLEATKYHLEDMRKIVFK